MGENPKDFLTQRVALEEEGQLRWVGGFSSRASLLLPLRDSLVRVFACDLISGLHVRVRMDMPYFMLIVDCVVTSASRGKSDIALRRW